MQRHYSELLSAQGKIFVFLTFEGAQPHKSFKITTTLGNIGANALGAMAFHGTKIDFSESESSSHFSSLMGSRGTNRDSSINTRQPKARGQP